MVVGMIELGDVGSVGGPHQAPRAGRPPARARRRGFGLVAVLVLLFTAVGSTPGRAGLAAPLWRATLAGTVFVLTPGGLYAVDRDHITVTARDARTGRVRWRRDVDGRPVLVLTPVGGVIAVLTQPETAGADTQDGPEPAVTLLAEATGAVIGTSSGQVWGLADGVLVLVRTVPKCRGEGCLDLVGVTVATAAEAWTVRLGQTTVADTSPVDGRMERFARVYGDGTVDIRSARTGLPIQRLMVPAIGGAENLASALIGGLFITVLRAYREVAVSAYPLDPTQPAWSATLPLSPPLTAETSYAYAAGCARLVCVHLGGGTALLDPRTGQVRGRTSGDVIAPRAGDPRVLVASALITGTGAQTSRGVFIVGAADGVATTVLPATASTPWAASAGRSLLSTPGRAGTAFTVVDPSGADRVVGTMTGTDLTCQASADLLGCADAVGGLRVWRLPAPDA